MELKRKKERLMQISIGFRESQLDAYDVLKEKEGGSLAEHVRIAFDEYLQKKKLLKKA